MNVSHCTVQLPTFLERNARSHVQAEPPSMSPHAAGRAPHKARARGSQHVTATTLSTHTAGQNHHGRDRSRARASEATPTHTCASATHTRQTMASHSHNRRFHTPSHTVTNRSHFMSTCNEHESHSRPHQTPPHAHQRQPLSILSAQRPRPPHTIHTTHSSHSLSLTHIVACCIRIYRT